jgi:superkiller protein 3
MAIVNERMGRMEEAVVCWRRAGQRDQNRRSAWLAAADRLLADGDAAGAVTCLRRALLDGEDAALWSRLGYAQHQAGAMTAAVRAYRRALALEPSRPGVRYNLGCALAEAGRYQEAARQLRRAVELEPGDAAAWNNLGHALAHLGEPEEGRRCFERALAADAGCHEAWNNLAGWHEEQGDHEAALRAYSRALEIVPANPAYRLGRAAILLALARREEAHRDLDQACAGEPGLRRLLEDLPPFAGQAARPRAEGTRRRGTA